MNDKARIEELVEILNNAAKAYYSTDKEIMSNYEYDKLYDELVELEDKTGIVLSSSPTHKVGYEVVGSLPKVVHKSPMLSLAKTKEVSDLIEFVGDKRSLLSWKMDGLTIVLTYKGGELESAVTRGNGEVGELITANARTFKNIPLRIPFKGELTIRGEAVISYKDFEDINASIEDVSEQYKNPRNLCSGSVRQKDSSVTASRNVNFFAFSLVEAEGMDFENSHEKEFIWLKEQGFSVVSYKVVDEKNLEEAVNSFALDIESFEFPTDGLVLLLDDISYGNSLGRTAKTPKNALAFKWRDEVRETILREIEWSPSRTGLLNPVAIFDTVDLEGTDVSRASLHNISYIEDLELGIGDRVTVYKANMIIPQIAENLTRSSNVELPKICPVCGEKLVVMELNSSKTLNCPNENCMAKHIKLLTHFVSRECFNIEGLSESTLEKFTQMGIIHDISQVFDLPLHEDVILREKGFAKKGFDNLTEALNKAREVSLPNFLNSLGISGVGLSNCKLLAKHFEGDINKIIGAGMEELTNIEGIGDVLAGNIRNYFDDEKKLGIVRKLLDKVNIHYEAVRSDNENIGGKVFVITGSVNFFKNRAELKERIESLGGKVASAVSANTDYLINNDKESSSKKNQEARKLGTAIISEEDFMKML